MLRREAVWAVVAVLTAAVLHAQPTIEHSGLRCMRPGEFVVVLSGIEPEDDVQTAKVYFRSRLYRDFYYVEMTYQDGQFVGILPEPSPETPGVVYYLEALDSAFNTARSREYLAEIQARCRQEPAAAYFPGGDPGITVGATASGASRLPPGFTAAGIVGTITAAGVASGVGGGIGAGAAVAIGAGAAAGAGAGVAVLATGSNETTSTSSVIAGSPATSAATTSSVTAGPVTTTSTNPGPGPTTTSTPGAPTTVPGGSTTTTTGGGPATTTGASSTTPTTTTTTVPAASLNASCFTVAPAGSCRVRVDARCVALPVDRYEWVLDLNKRWTKVEFPDGPPVLTHTWTDNEGCDNDGETLRFRLKVRRGNKTSTALKNLFVPGKNLRAPSEKNAVIAVRSQVMLPERLSGQLLVNGELLRNVESGPPVTLRAQVRRGENTLAGIVTTASSHPATWRLELDAVVPGSVHVVSGDVLTHDARAVVFRLSGRPGERVELTFVPRE